MNLKLLREQNNKQQNEIAKILNTSSANYNRYELEKVKPRIETLISLANFYNVSLDYLIGRQFNNNIGYIPEEKKEVVKLLLQLNEQNTIKSFGYIAGLLANQN